MSTVDSTTSPAPRKRRSFSNWLCAVEDVARRHGVRFDSEVTDPTDTTNEVLHMGLDLTGWATLPTEFDEAEFADCYSQFCEEYAKRLANLAVALKQKFPLQR